MSYSWYNIAEAYSNNKIRWRKKTESWKPLFFSGWNARLLRNNSFLQGQTGKVDPKDKDSGSTSTLYFDMRIYRVVILMLGDNELDLTQGGFAKLLGYERKVLTGAENHVGETVQDITRSVDWVFVHCDLITRRVTDVPSDVLYNNGAACWLPAFSKEAIELQWHPVNKSEIYSIRIRVTDGRNNPLDLNGIDLALNLRIEKE